MWRSSLGRPVPGGRALAADLRGARALCTGPPARLALFLAIARPVLTVPSVAQATHEFARQSPRCGSVAQATRRLNRANDT
jgi:hypothetical protein